MGKRGPKLQEKCKRGHELSGANLIFRKRGTMEVRECRTCANARYRDRRKRKKGELADLPDPLSEVIRKC
jgi:hypothetical protein